MSAADISGQLFDKLEEDIEGTAKKTEELYQKRHPKEETFVRHLTCIESDYTSRKDDVAQDEELSIITPTLEE